MPIPTPQPNQSEQSFIGHCMEVLADDYKDNKQRAAVCYSTWRKHKNKTKSESAEKKEKK